MGVFIKTINTLCYLNTVVYYGPAQRPQQIEETLYMMTERIVK